MTGRLCARRAGVRPDDVTFHHPDVVRQTIRHFTMIKVDVTQGGNPVHERLLKRR
jgi:hypothetical protein